MSDSALAVLCSLVPPTGYVIGELFDWSSRCLSGSDQRSVVDFLEARGYGAITRVGMTYLALSPRISKVNLSRRPPTNAA